MTTLVTFLEDLILSWVIVYATYSLMRLAAHSVRWMVRSIGPHAPKRVGRPHVR
jgi:hypothetical protein